MWNGLDLCITSSFWKNKGKKKKRAEESASTPKIISAPLPKKREKRAIRNRFSSGVGGGWILPRKKGEEREGGRPEKTGVSRDQLIYHFFKEKKKGRREGGKKRRNRFTLCRFSYGPYARPFFCGGKKEKGSMGEKAIPSMQKAHHFSRMGPYYHLHSRKKKEGDGERLEYLDLPDAAYSISLSLLTPKKKGKGENQ